MQFHIFVKKFIITGRSLVSISYQAFCYIINFFNVQGQMDIGASYLLDWVNIQRLEQGKTRQLINFSELLQEQFLFEILKQIDLITFENFQLEGPTKKMDIIEKYMEREFGKRLRWSFKQKISDLTKAQSIMQLSKLTCYLSIHSKKKNQFVTRILELSEECQRFLMEEMQGMDHKLQNITEIKQIIEQIENLEQQNEDLKEKLEQMNRVNNEMLEIIKETDAENKILKTQIQVYRKQKIEVFAALEIQKITEYLQAYNKLKQQSERSLSLLKQFQEKLEKQEQNNKYYNQRAKGDCIVITTLSQQVNKLKQIIKQSYAKQEYLQWPFSSSSKQNILKSASNNKQNMSKCSTSLGKSMQIPTQWLSFSENDDSLGQKSTIRVHNHQLMTNLEQMYKKYNSLNKQASDLRQSNQKYRQKNKELKKILKEVDYCYRQFEFKYKVSAEENKRLISYTNCQQKRNYVQ